MYEEYCGNGKKRALFGYGISLGSGILSNYIGKEGDNCKLECAFALGCHFDTEIAMAFLKTHMLGFYDYALGLGCRYYCKFFFE